MELYTRAQLYKLEQAVESAIDTELDKLHGPDDYKARIHLERLMAAMTLEEKVAQTIQAEAAVIAPADAARYKLGSVLTGGNGGPGGVEKAPALEWLKLADAYWEASRAATPRHHRARERV